MTGSPNRAAMGAEGKLALKGRHVEFWQQISFLLLNQNVAAKGKADVSDFANAAPVGNKQPSHTATFLQELVVDFIPGRTINQDIADIFYNEISCSP